MLLGGTLRAELANTRAAAAVQPPLLERLLLAPLPAARAIAIHSLSRQHPPLAAGCKTMRAAAAFLLAACLLLPAALAQRRKALTDDNFEHVTQAATGQTTGVW